MYTKTLCETAFAKLIVRLYRITCFDQMFRSSLLVSNCHCGSPRWGIAWTTSEASYTIHSNSQLRTIGFERFILHTLFRARYFIQHISHNVQYSNTYVYTYLYIYIYIVQHILHYITYIIHIVYIYSTILYLITLHVCVMYTYVCFCLLTVVRVV